MLFWDIKKGSVNSIRHKRFIITRTLEQGKLEDVRRLLKRYNKSEIKQVVKTAKLSEKTAHFWANYLAIPKSNVKCLQLPYIQTRKKFWPY